MKKQYIDLLYSGPLKAELIKMIGYSTIGLIRDYPLKKYPGSNLIKICYGYRVTEENFKIVGSFWREFDYIFAQGNLKFLKAISRKPFIDFLVPQLTQRNSVDLSLFKMARKHDLPLGIPISDFIFARGQKLANFVSNLELVAKFQKKFNFKVIFGSGAKTFYGLRTPLDIIAFGRYFGFSAEIFTKILTVTPLQILRKRLEIKERRLLPKGVYIYEKKPTI